MRSDWITTIGLLAAACTTLSYLPQVVKIIRTKHTKDISLLMYLILGTGLFLWFVYGLLLRDLPILIANGITFVLSLGVLILKMKYG
ncbi:MAG: SemiSWEET transporter [Thermodesulfovibrionales bacterium]|jgi:MtN3 and saliva related transmembrane protein